MEKRNNLIDGLFKMFIILAVCAVVVHAIDFFNEYLRAPIAFLFQLAFFGGLIIWGISSLFKKKGEE